MAEEAPWLLAEGNSYGRFDHQGPYNYSTTIRAEEVNLDERCHQSVPSDRSISTLVNEAGRNLCSFLLPVIRQILRVTQI